MSEQYIQELPFTTLPKDMLIKILGFVNRMIGKAQPAITDAEDCVKFFAEQYEQLLKMPDMRVRTAVVDVSEYIQCDQLQKAEMIQQAEQFPATQFIWSQKRPTNKQYIGLWRDFDKRRRTNLGRKDLAVGDDADNWEEMLLDPHSHVDYQRVSVKRKA